MYNSNGLKTKFEISNGIWEKWVYNKKGRLVDIKFSVILNDVKIKIK